MARRRSTVQPQASGSASAESSGNRTPPQREPAPPKRERTPDLRERMPWAARIACAALLVVFAVQAGVAARRDSVTIDEFGHLPMGLRVLKTADFSVDPINPHLARIWAALPALIDPPVFEPDPKAGVWALGYQLLGANTARYHEIFERSRWMIIALSLITAALTAVWTRKLYGWKAAVVSLWLFAFAPSLLAHGHLVTVDLAGTLGFLASLMATWWLLDKPTRARAATLGVALGLSNLLKLSAFVLSAIVLAVVVVRMWQERDVRPKQWISLLLITGAVALLTLNAGYLFDGTFSPIGRAALAPEGKLGRLAAVSPGLRLPLPQPFLEGLDMALEVGKVREPSYFLAGEMSAEGWWYYHLAAFAAKCPLPVLLASLLAMAMWAGGRSTGRRDYAVFIPVVLIFAANTAFNSFYIGERHVLPVYPLLFVGAAPWLVRGLERARSPHTQQRALAAVSAVALIWTAAGTLAVAPRYLQYFNEAAGGPGGGHRMLIDSNIDWGQDLVRLKEYMAENGVESIALAYFGRVDPGAYGIRYTPLEPGRTKGKAAVSATFLMGRPYFWILGGRTRWVPYNTYAYLQGQTPIARVGAMFIYDLK